MWQIVASNQTPKRASGTHISSEMRPAVVDHRNRGNKAMPGHAFPRRKSSWLDSYHCWLVLHPTRAGLASILGGDETTVYLSTSALVHCWFFIDSGMDGMVSSSGALPPAERCSSFYIVVSHPILNYCVTLWPCLVHKNFWFWLAFSFVFDKFCPITD